MLFDKQPTDLDLVRYLLGEMYDNLDERVARAKYLAALDTDFGGEEGTMLFGGTPAFLAYEDARACWIAGNYVSTVLVCQALLENLLTAYLHAASVEVGKRPRLEQSLKECRTAGLLTEQDERDIVRLVRQRNPLTHFRLLEDPDHLDRRAMDSGAHPVRIAQDDARLAITVVVRILGKAIFALGGKRTRHEDP